jgi:hypothetical protein
MRWWKLYGTPLINFGLISTTTTLGLIMLQEKLAFMQWKETKLEQLKQ